MKKEERAKGDVIRLLCWQKEKRSSCIADTCIYSILFICSSHRPRKWAWKRSGSVYTSTRAKSVLLIAVVSVVTVEIYDVFFFLSCHFIPYIFFCFLCIMRTHNVCWRLLSCLSFDGLSIHYCIAIKKERKKEEEERRRKNKKRRQLLFFFLLFLSILFLLSLLFFIHMF